MNEAVADCKTILEALGGTRCHLAPEGNPGFFNTGNGRGSWCVQECNDMACKVWRHFRFNTARARIDYGGGEFSVYDRELRKCD